MTARAPLSQIRRIISTTIVLTMMIGILGVHMAPAAPIGAAVAPAATTQGSLFVGPASVAVLTTDTAVPIGGEFSYRVSVRSPNPADFVQARMRLFMPDSRKLVYQKTFVEPAPTSGVLSFEFSRSIADIDLDAGAYPVEVSVRIVSGGQEAEGIIPATLLVYDTERPALPVAIIARVGAVPLTDANGGFAIDPAQFTRARDDVGQLCEYVISDPNARLTLSLSPLMLAEWRQVARGYSYEGPEGTSQVTSDAPVPLAYGATLDRIAAAVETGRLELLSVGFSDPSLAELGAAGILNDLPNQFDAGVSTTRATVRTTPSTGTCPPDGNLSEAIAKRVLQQDVRYAVISGRWSQSAGKPTLPGAYRATESELRVLVSDDEAVRALTTSPTAESISHAFEHHLESSGTPLPLCVAVGPDAASAENVIAFARNVESAPWGALALAKDVAGTPRPRKVRLMGASADTRAPAGHWRAIAEARRWSRALAYSIGRDADEAAAAEHDSLTAEASAWSGTAGEWEHAERSLGYAANAERTARDILDRVALSARAVTLAGTKGEVPITVSNQTGRPVRVRLVVSASEGVRLGQGSTREVVLQPQDNFIEVPVDLRGGISGSLHVRLLAADVELDQRTVPLKASIIDRLVILAGIVVVLVGLLTYIITKVRAAENRGADTDNGDERYT